MHASPPPPRGSMAPAMRAFPFALNLLLSLLSTCADKLAAGAAPVAEGQRTKRMEAAGRRQTSSSEMAAQIHSARSSSPSLLSRAPLPACPCLCERGMAGLAGPLSRSPSMTRRQNCRSAAVPVALPLVLPPAVCRDDTDPRGSAECRQRNGP